MEALHNEDLERLVEAARKASQNAYAPYSHFLVGAAALGFDGKIYSGCNVENVSFSLTNCAERTAIFKSISEGNMKFRALAVYADSLDYCYPCGACRQVIAEFGRDIPIIQANGQGQYIINTIEELLPGAFGPNNLRKGNVFE